MTTIETGQVITAGIAVISTAAGVYYIVRTRDLFHPISLLSIMYCVSGVLPVTVGMFYNSLSTNQVTGLMWVSIGYLLTMIGFGMFGGKLRSYQSPTTVKVRTGFTVVIYLITLGIDGWLTGERIGTFIRGNLAGSLGPIAELLVAIHDPAYWLVLLALSRRRGALGVLAAVAVLGTEVVLDALKGSKAAVVFAVLPFLFFFGRPRGWSMRRVMMWGIGAMIMLIASFPIVDAYRQGQSVGFANLVIATGHGNVSSSSVLLIAERLDWTRNVGLVIQQVPSQHEYLMGSSLWPALFWYVPRQLWAEKPSMSIGAWFAHTFLGWDPASPSEAAVTVWGDAWLNFGPFGVAALALILGALYAIMYRVWSRHRSVTIALVFWLFLSHFVIGIERNLTALVASFGLRLLVVIPLGLSSTRRARRGKGYGSVMPSDHASSARVG